MAFCWRRGAGPTEELNTSTPTRSQAAAAGAEKPERSGDATGRVCPRVRPAAPGRGSGSSATTQGPSTGSGACSRPRRWVAGGGRTAKRTRADRLLWDQPARVRPRRHWGATGTRPGGQHKAGGDFGVPVGNDREAREQRGTPGVGVHGPTIKARNLGLGDRHHPH